jgi:carbon-monoxide dehydrogenase large subunit
MATSSGPITAGPFRRTSRYHQQHGEKRVVSLSFIGQPRRRIEDRRLLVGDGRYVGDLPVRESGALHLVFARSPFAHARVSSIDATPAEAMPGVVRVATGRDLTGLRPLPPPGAPFLPGFEPSPPYQPMAIDEVRFVGEPVAAVVADSLQHAQDAVAALDIAYESLPAVADAEAAMAPDAPRVHADRADNILAHRHHVAGEPDAAFASAAHVIRRRLRHARVAAIPMEPRGVIAAPERADGPRDGAADGRLVVRSSTQAPFLARNDLATSLGVEPQRLRVISPDVGGGFGAKALVHPEEAVVAWLARDLGRPVVWLASRSEDLHSTMQGRDMVSDVEAAVDDDGTIRALRLRTVANIGAYPLWQGPLPAMRLLQYPTGCYAIDHLDSELHMVLTNTAPTGPYRGAGRPEAAFVAERLVDEIAAELDLDPVDVRRRNFIPPDAFPYTNAGGITYDSGNYAAALDLALAHADYDRLRAEQAARRGRGELVGIGLATYTEVAGGGFEGAQVEVLPDGSVQAHTGASAQGQGHQTTFAQIVADHLGVDPSVVRVIGGDTDAPMPGIGTFGSRSVVLGGSALANASDVVRQRALRVAATLLEAAPDDLELRAGRAFVRGAEQRSIDLGAVAAAATQGLGLAADEPHALREASRFTSTDGDTFPFGACVALVSVARETGQVSLERIVLVDDCGTVINPLLVDGQLAGGAAQGIGEALREAIVYSADGQLVTGSLLDYAVPRASDIPTLVLDRTITPSPRNPLGAKGVGEAGTVGTPAAIANAVIDALRPLGITNVDLPITAEQLWRLLPRATP